MKKVILIATILAALAPSVMADIPNPDKYPKKTGKVWNGHMTIYPRADVGMATLTIRKNKLKELRAAIDEADDRENNTAALVASTDLNRTQTIAAGLLLSIGLVIGGLVVFKRKTLSPRVIAGIVLVTAGTIGAIAVLANAPPPRVVSLSSAIFDKSTKAYGYASGQINIQVVDDTSPAVRVKDDVVLEIPTAPEDRQSEE